jgi:hypothetical protein
VRVTPFSFNSKHFGNRKERTTTTTIYRVADKKVKHREVFSKYIQYFLPMVKLIKGYRMVIDKLIAVFVTTNIEESQYFNDRRENSRVYR